MDINQLISAPTQTAIGSAANNTATATAAGRAGFIVIVKGITVSANGAAATSVLVTVSDSTNGSMEEFYLPAAAFAPIAINYHNGLPGSVGGTVSASIPALGAAITGRVVLKYFYIWA